MSPVDDARFALSVVPRYAEVDQQSVVFHAHYLTWFDEAWTAYLDHRSLHYPDLISAGVDFQVVRSEIDYRAPVRWRDTVRVVVACESVGTTSFTVTFDVLRTDGDRIERTAVRGRNVYVTVSTDDWAKRPVPDELRRIFADSAPG